MGLRGASVGGLAVLLSGCALWSFGPSGPRDDLHVLLPGKDGRAGALTVTHAGQETLLDRPYAAMRVTGPAAAQPVTVSPTEVQQVFGAALAAQPPRPVSFFLYFVGGTDELTPESQQAAQGLLAEIARRPAPEVVVIGHTDRVGTVEFNDGLSVQRAARVRDHLVKLGVPPERIRVEGRGEREPAIPTADEVPEPRNRRVEVTAR